MGRRTGSAPAKRKSAEPKEMRRISYSPNPPSNGSSSLSPEPPVVREYIRFKKQDPPIVDYNFVPEGWNPDDYDIAPEDIEANITRCQERIYDGIMPQWWAQKLKIYEKEKAKGQDIIRSMPKGLDWKTITRIKNLQHIKRHLETYGDEFDQLVNVDVLIGAYLDGSLVWDDKVTYLSNGRSLVTQPIKFECADVHKYNEMCNAKSFWVEGLNGPGPTCMKPFHTRQPFRGVDAPLNDRGLHSLKIHVRVPGVAVMPDNIMLDFLDDSGAEIPRIFYTDLHQLVNRASGRQAPFLCYQVFRTTSDWVVEPTCLLEFNITRSNGDWVRPWVSQQVALSKGYTLRSTDRLSGLWMRQLFYVGHAPDNNGNLYIAETHSGINTILPNVDNVNATVPDPSYTIENHWDYLLNWRPDDLLNAGPQGGPYLMIPPPSDAGSSSSFPSPGPQPGSVSGSTASDPLPQNPAIFVTPASGDDDSSSSPPYEPSLSGQSSPTGQQSVGSESEDDSSSDDHGPNIGSPLGEPIGSPVFGPAADIPYESENQSLFGGSGSSDGGSSDPHTQGYKTVLGYQPIARTSGTGPTGLAGSSSNVEMESPPRQTIFQTTPSGHYALGGLPTRTPENAPTPGANLHGSTAGSSDGDGDIRMTSSSPRGSPRAGRQPSGYQELQGAPAVGANIQESTAGSTDGDIRMTSSSPRGSSQAGHQQSGDQEGGNEEDEDEEPDLPSLGPNVRGSTAGSRSGDMYEQ